MPHDHCTPFKVNIIIFDSDVQETGRIANTYIKEKLNKADDYLSIIDVFKEY